MGAALLRKTLPLAAMTLAACAGRHSPVSAPPAGSLHGRVVVSAGRADGIEVRFCQGGKNRSAVTSSNGAFHFEALESGASFVFVSEAVVGLDVKSVTITATTPAEMDLQPRAAGRVGGTVVDDNGNPIPGAKVQLLPRLGGDAGMTHPEETAAGHIPEDALACLRSVSTRLVTDKDGRFSAANVVGDQGVRVVVDAPGFFDLGPEGGGSRNIAPGALDVEIDLTQRGRVEGSVHGKDDGFVVADAKGFRKVVPVKTGHFSLSLDPGIYDVYYVDVESKKKNTSSSKPFAHHGLPQKITAKAGGTVRVELDP